MFTRLALQRVVLFCCCWVAALCCAESISPPDFAGHRIPGIVLSFNSDPLARAEFAVAALSEMAVALSEETELARDQLQSLTEDRGLLRWISSVERYIDELLRLADDITVDTPVRLYANAEGNLFLLIDGQSIMVSAPRIELQPSFERRVMEQFCQQYSCQESMQPEAPGTAVTAVAGAPPRWSFGEDLAASCLSDDGLVLQFASMKNLGPKREACLQVVGELRRIAEGMAQLKARGVAVDWNALVVRGIPASDDYQLDVNRHGDALTLPIPWCAVLPELLQQARPWLVARSNNRQYTLLLDDAEQLLAPMLVE